MNVENKVILVLSEDDYELAEKAFKTYIRNRINAREKQRVKKDIQKNKQQFLMELPETLENFKVELVQGKLYPVNVNLEKLNLEAPEN